MKTTRILLVGLLAVCVSLFTVACNTTVGTDQQQIIAKLAVQYAVIKVVENNPAKAARVVDIAREVRDLAGKDGANTVDLLMALVRAKVDFSKLDAADTLLANALIDTIGAQLKERVGAGTLGTDKLPIVAEVANWVIEGAGAVHPVG